MVVFLKLKIQLIMISEAEKTFCEYQLGMSGSFTRLLIEAMMIADPENMDRLSRGFPDLCMVVYQYQNDKGYWEQLVKVWNFTHESNKLEV